MNVLVVGINYAPESTGFAPHTTALCEYLTGRGNRVTVITGFPFAPYWARWASYRRKLILRECLNSVEILRVTHFIPRRPKQMVQRILMEGTYCLALAQMFLARAGARWDVILYVGAQPSIAMVARLIARLKGVPYMVKITDLAAQAAADVGIVKSVWLNRVLARFEYAAYRRASGAIVLCAGFQEALVARGYPSDRIRIIRDSVDLKLIRPRADGGAFRHAIQLSPDDFVVLYSGSMGIKQGLINVVEAARLSRCEAPAVKWVLVGDGELRPGVERRIADQGLEGQVRLLPLQPEEQMSVMYSSADVLLLSQVSSVKDTVIPSKLLTYMAAGRPVLAAVNSASQGALLLREAGGGMIVTPDDPVALAAGVRSLQADREKLGIMGRRNRQYAEEHFDRKQILAAQEAFLVETVKDFTSRQKVAV